MVGHTPGGSHAGPTRSRHDEQGGADDMSIPATTSAHHAVPPGLDWDADPRWRQVRRDYRPEDVLRLRPSLPVEHTLARHGAERLWELLSGEEYVACLGALTGGQAVQMVKAGLQAIY